MSECCVKLSIHQSSTWLFLLYLILCAYALSLFPTAHTKKKKADLNDKCEITFGICNGVCLHFAFILRVLVLLMGKEKADKISKK